MTRFKAWCRWFVKGYRHHAALARKTRDLEEDIRLLKLRVAALEASRQAMDNFATTMALEVQEAKAAMGDVQEVRRQLSEKKPVKARTFQQFKQMAEAEV